MTVAEALNFSREAHERYRDALPRRVPNGSGGTVAVAGDSEAAGIALAEACRFRAEAHALDSQQTEPAWADEAASHDHVALLDFYVAQLIREPEIIQDATVGLVTAIDEARGVFAPEPVVEMTPPVAIEPIRLQVDPAIVDTGDIQP